MTTFFLLLSIAVTTLAIERVMKIFFIKRKSPLILIVLSYSLLYLSLMLSGVWWTFFIHLFALFVVSLNYESTLMKRVASIGGSLYVMLSLTGIINAVAHFLPTDWYAENRGLTALLISFLVYVMTWIAYLMFKHIKTGNINLNKLWLPLIIFPVIYIIIELFYFFIDRTVVGIAANTFHFLSVVIIIFYLYNVVSKVVADNIEAALHSQEKEYYFAQCQLMQETMEKMKSVRHDIKMHLATLKDHTSDNQVATNYLNRLLGDINESKAYSDTGNIAFDSIINFKLSNAKFDNIALDLNVAVPPEINVEVADIVTIIGNLLDNALEAVTKTTEKFIKLDIEYGKGGLFIRVDNAFNGEISYLDNQIGTEKQIVSSKNSDEHGYGLKNIRQSVEKYNGYLKIIYDKTIFSVVAFLYVDIHSYL